MALSRFWLLNGSKKKGKKSVKKVSKKTARKISAKKSIVKTIKKVSKPKKVVKVIKEKVYVAKPITRVPATIMTMEERINKDIRRNKLMARRKRRSVAKATKRVKRVKKSMALATVGKKHRVTAYMKRGVLKTSRKSKIAKRNYKINPFKVKGIVNKLKSPAILSASSVGTIVAMNKFLPKMPYIDRVNNSVVKAGIKVALGLLAQMGVKKFIKNSDIANGVLVGAIISAMTDFVNVQPTSVAGIKLNGVKVLGNPLSFGRPKTPLANPNFQMNGIKINKGQDLKAIQFKKNYNADNTVSGSDRW